MLTPDRGLPEVARCNKRGHHEHTKHPPVFEVIIICVFYYLVLYYISYITIECMSKIVISNLALCKQKYKFVCFCGPIFINNISVMYGSLLI